MSKQNKVNPGQYHVAGRLTPDDAARERVKQRNVNAATDTAPRSVKAPASRAMPKGGTTASAPSDQARPKTRSASRSRSS
jgi:hypothetical protein